MRKIKSFWGWLFSLVMAAAIVAGISCTATETSKPEAETQVSVDSVPSADGVMIYYDVRGEGSPALVFVHCWCCDRGYWSGQTGELGKHYKVVTIDLAGHGQSGTGREKWTMQAFGADVAAVVNKLGLDNVILIGHSMGGPVNVAAARQLPGKVIGLVGVDIYNALGTTYTEDQVKAFLQPFRDDFESTVRVFLRPMFPATADSTLVARVIDDMSSAPPEIGVGAFEELFKYYFSERIVADLKELNLPMRCINADQNPTDFEANRAVVPSFDAKIMPGKGHFLHLEDPETFNRLLKETIVELSSGTP